LLKIKSRIFSNTTPDTLTQMTIDVSIIIVGIN